MRLIILYITFILGFESIAQTLPLKKGDVAPFDGIIFDSISAKKLRNDLIDKDACDKTSDSYKRSIELQDLSLKFRKEQVDMLQQQNGDLMKFKSANEYEKYLWFGLGILLMGGAVYGAGQLRK